MPSEVNNLAARFKYLRAADSDSAWHCAQWVELPFVGTACGLVINLGLAEVWFVNQADSQAVFSRDHQCPYCRASDPGSPVWGGARKANNPGNPGAGNAGVSQGHSQVGAGGAARHGTEAPRETA